MDAAMSTICFYCVLLPNGIDWVVQTHAHALQDSRQQALGALQTALACFGNAHGQSTGHVGLLLDWYSVTNARF